MAMSKLHLVSLLFFFSLLNLPFITISETPCPYPCYPPPTGGGSTQPAGNYPQPTGYYPPPTGYYTPPTGYYTPPTSGNVPNYPSPPYTGGNSGGYYGPPPPDPILPYFPFYYRKPPHQTDQSSFAVKLTVRIVTVANFLAVVVFLVGNVLFTSSM